MPMPHHCKCCTQEFRLISDTLMQISTFPLWNLQSLPSLFPSLTPPPPVSDLSLQTITTLLLPLQPHIPINRRTKRRKPPHPSAAACGPPSLPISPVIHPALTEFFQSFFALKPSMQHSVPANIAPINPKFFAEEYEREPMSRKPRESWVRRGREVVDGEEPGDRGYHNSSIWEEKGVGLSVMDGGKEGEKLRKGTDE